MEFDWDEEKDRINVEKHGIAFAGAIAVFEADGLEFFDEEHSVREERFITVGPVGGRLALVVWTERPGPVIRIISARWATPRERRLYQQHMEPER